MTDRLTQPEVSGDSILDRFYALERQVQSMAEDLAELRKRGSSICVSPGDGDSTPDVLYVRADDGSLWRRSMAPTGHWAEIEPVPQPLPAQD